ncbi:MAG: histidine phosphatase family protein [Candidatus Rokubacteria bacterium]|nr:histidine phosphatase family protein [Candidatus Rokubacteria bacterium]
MKLRLIVLMAALPLAILATPFGADAQRAVLVVRHAEQLDDSTDSLLSEAGQRRAKALAVALKDAGITAIYTSEFQRTIQTAAPLATALGISATVVPRKDTEELIRRLRERHSQDIVLVVTHSGSLRAHGTTVPALLKALGHLEEVRIPRTEYGSLFVIVPKSEGPPVVVRLRFE